MWDGAGTGEAESEAAGMAVSVRVVWEMVGGVAAVRVGLAGVVRADVAAAGAAVVPEGLAVEARAVLVELEGAAAAAGAAEEAAVDLGAEARVALGVVGLGRVG